MSSLLPDQLHSAASTGTPNNSIVILPEAAYETHKRKKRQIPDIATWVQVYSVYTLILTTQYPEAVKELIAYQLFIVQHSRKFEYPSWLHYDTDFRQWAAANRYTTWSQINPQLYAYAFTAHGRGARWCPVCHMDGEQHTFDCPKFALSSPLPFTRPPTRAFSVPTQRPLLPSPVPPAISARLGPPPGKKPRESRPGYCILFNKHNGQCPFEQTNGTCKFPHRCAHCAQLGHPVSACPARN